jgi:c-di-GMP-related signal transduction protein
VNDAVPTPGGAHLVHVGRQPIFHRGGDVVACELLFRGSWDAVEAGRFDSRRPETVGPPG